MSFAGPKVQVQRRLLSSKEVATILGIRENYVRRLVAEGKLRSIQFRKRGDHHFDPDEVDRLIRGER
jgi:excisionase family DNA binding protein